MGFAAIAFLFGIGLLLQMPDLPDPRLCLALPLLLVVAYGLPRFRLPIWVLAGFLWALWRASLLLSPGLSPVLEGQDLVIDCRVTSLPRALEHGVRFQVEVARAVFKAQPVAIPERLRLSWYRRAPDLVPGERWRLTVRLKRPHGFANPGGFDYEAWLFRQGLGATGYVRREAQNLRLEAARGEWMNRIRQVLGAHIDAVLPGHPYAGPVKALAVGLRDTMDSHQWEVLRRTGTNHLMAISGLHIGLVAGLVFILARRFWSLLPRAPLLLAAPRFAAIPALLAAVAYAFLAGFSVPTQRAVVMVTVFMLSLFLNRSTSPRHNLGIALWGVLLLDPLTVLSPGFWLSFGAVAVILYGMAGRLAVSGVWWRWGRVHWVVAIGLIPLMLAVFGQNPLWSPVANLVAVPWMGIVAIPLVLSGTLLVTPWPFLGGVLLFSGAQAIGWLWGLLEWMADYGGVYQGPIQGSLWLVAAGAVGVGLLLAPRGVPCRWLGALWLAPLVFVPLPRPAPGELWMTLLDVGQGLSAVLRTRDHTLVFDTGPSFSRDFDAGRAVVVPFLRQRGVPHLDTLIVSHGDGDHNGGTPALLAEYPPRLVLSGSPERVPRARDCHHGQQWTWDGVRFEILHPEPHATLKGNNVSCVLLAATRGQVLLLPGDIEKPGEKALLRHVGSRLKADVLVAPHHGSTTSSTRALVDTVRPGHVLFSTGYRNRFGFPRKAVTSRYVKYGARLYDTARLGGIQLVLGNGAIQPVGYRDVNRHPWSWRADER